MAEERVPVVFISYSYDSREHKMWVAKLASQLVANGVDVILDQWELEPGDSIPKFMEGALGKAERVLLVCTDKYVLKANDGKGGVGYEAMIVTAEVVRNMATSRFIPVIRSPNTEAAMPTCLSGRYYVDMRSDPEFESKLDELLRALLRAPAVEKPALGRNPFAQSPSGEELPTAGDRPAGTQTQGLATLSDFHSRAVVVARSGDMYEWRRLVHEAKRGIPESMAAWRSNHEPSPPQELAQLRDFAQAGIEAFIPLMVVALTGVESGRQDFRTQTAMVDEIAYPRDWQGSGLTLVVRMPEAALYVFQALHGALSILTKQTGLAMAFASTIVDPRNGAGTSPLFRNPYLTTYPESLGGRWDMGWDFLLSALSRFPVLAEFYLEEEDYHASLYAYYFALNVLELATSIASIDPENPAAPDCIPIMLTGASDRILRKAQGMLKADVEGLSSIWLAKGVSTDKMRAHWRELMDACIGQNRSHAHAFGLRGTIPQVALFDEI
jgi:hypothetical protein